MYINGLLDVFKWLTLFTEVHYSLLSVNTPLQVMLSEGMAGFGNMPSTVNLRLCLIARGSARLSLFTSVVRFLGEKQLIISLHLLLRKIAERFETDLILFALESKLQVH